MSTTGLLLMAHAPLASALRDVAAHVYPDGLASLQVLDVPPEWSADQVEAEARRLLAEAGHGQTLVLTDVFGATPCNVAQRLGDGREVRVVAGVNVPMLWRVLCYRHEPLDVLVGRATAGGGQGVMSVSLPRPQIQSQDLSAHHHAATDAHHQQ